MDLTNVVIVQTFDSKHAIKNFNLVPIHSNWNESALNVYEWMSMTPIEGEEGE